MDLSQANAYFDKHVKYDSWNSYSTDMQSRALAQAERVLSSYAVDSTALGYAICEQALWLLQGDKRAELQQSGVAGFGLGSVSEQFNTRGRPTHIAPQAWAFIRQNSGTKGGYLM